LAELQPAQAQSPEKSQPDSQPTHKSTRMLSPEQYRQRQVAHAVGGYLTKNIISPVDDSILAKRGQMVTYGLIDEAHQLGVDQQIFDHVSNAPVPAELPRNPKPGTRPGAHRQKKPLMSTIESVL
jgi:hypothetical protein